MKRYAFGITLLLIAISAGVAAATPPANIAATILARGTSSDRVAVIEPRITLERIALGDPVVSCGPARNCDVAMQTITLQPGGTTGWHSHPGLVAVVVRSGTVTRYETGHLAGGCSAQSYAARQAFVERGSDHVVVVRNETAQPAELLVTYIVPAGAALRIDQPAPAGCSAQS